jgi:hypothetical protein
VRGRLLGALWATSAFLTLALADYGWGAAVSSAFVINRIKRRT